MSATTTSQNVLFSGGPPGPAELTKYARRGHRGFAGAPPAGSAVMGREEGPPAQRWMLA